MSSAKPWATRAAALGIAVAAPATVLTTPAPALAAPEVTSCAGFGTFAAQAGTEMIRLNRLEIRHAADKGRPVAPPSQPSPNSAGDSPKGGEETREPDSERDSKPAESPAEKPAGEPAGEPAEKPSDERSEKPSGNSDGVLEGVGDLLSLHSTSPEARKPTGPGTTDVDAPVAAPAQGEPPAPQPTSASKPTFAPVAKPTTEKGPKDFAVRDVLVGEAKSALVTNGRPNAAAITRMVNSSEKSKLSNPLVQQAPPVNPKAARRDTPAAEVGPLLIDGGTLSSHARNGCEAGEATRSSADLGAAAIADDGSDALVVSPDRMTAVTTTALDHSGPQARSVSSAALTAGTFELLDGAVHVKVIRSPRLTTSMSVTGAAEVRYAPAILEISGKGIETTTLDTAGDRMEMTFNDRTESAERPVLPGLDNFPVEPPLTLPSVPGLPVLGGGTPEAAPAGGPGTTVRIGLGKARQVAESNAVAARATAIEVSITKRGPESKKRGKPGYGNDQPGGDQPDDRPGHQPGDKPGGDKPGHQPGGARTEVTLDMSIGVLESASVAARPTGRGVSAGMAGGAGSLPVTGPGIAVLAIGGAGLLAAGAVAFMFGRRRRTFRA